MIHFRDLGDWLRNKLFHFCMRIRYGAPLWAYMLTLLKAIHQHKALSKDQQLSMFRQPVQRKWQAVHHSVPSMQDVEKAFRATSRALEDSEECVEETYA